MYKATEPLTARCSSPRPIGDVLAAYLGDLLEEGPDSDALLRARIRRSVRRPELWSAGAESEQLRFDLRDAA